MVDSILQNTPIGLYCAAGDFYIDPRQPVRRAVVTHAHSDHARWGSRHYLAAAPGELLLRMRMGTEADFQFLPYGESLQVGGVALSFHPAGHILGSAQVRLEAGGRVEVVTGDYKLGDDPTCASWEAVRCHLLVTESTFGLPIYRWPDEEVTRNAINAWWRVSVAEGKCCVLYGYAVGKSQRLLASLDPSIGPIYTHGAVEKGCEVYRASGVSLPGTQYVGQAPVKNDWRGAMVIAVPSAHGTTWARRFGVTSTAMASGWMMTRGTRRRRSVDRGFIVSDHVDWPSLLAAVAACDPETVWVTHGYSAIVARYLQSLGRDAHSIDNRSRTEGEEDRLDEQAVSEQVVDEPAVVEQAVVERAVVERAVDEQAVEEPLT